MANGRGVSLGFLRIIAGIFFVVLGIYGIMQNVNEGLFSLNSPKGNQTIEIVFGVVELVCGLFLALGGVGILTLGTAHIGGLVIMIFWIIRIIMTKFLWGLSFVNNGIRFIPDIYTWILSLVTELLILSVLFLLSARH